MLLVGFLLTRLLFPDARALSVEEAYRAIPHGRTPFVPVAAQKDGMPVEQAAELALLFSIVDEAIVAKVELGNVKTPPEKVRARYAPLIARAQALSGKGPVGGARELVIQAMTEQREYFVIRAGMRTPASDQELSERIRRSSAALHQAYQVLIEGYPKQRGAVKQAFFDYLCALDFI